MSDATTIVVHKDDIEDGEGVVRNIDDLTKVAIFRWGEEFFAIDNRCPHLSASLGEGDFDGTIVTCPLHGYRIDVRTGRCLNSGFRRQKLYPLEIVGDEIHVKIG